jgi:hypothetical protein
MIDPNLNLIFRKIFASYSLILIIFGTILNPIVCFVCFKSKVLRKTSTFKLLAIASLNDMLTLYEWNEDNFTVAFFNYLASNQNLFYCRFVTMFLQYVTLEFSSWMWALISFDRYLSLRVKMWSKQYFSGIRPVICSAALALVIVAINSNEIFTTGYSYTLNDTEYVVCGPTSPNNYFWYNTMKQVRVENKLFNCYFKVF